MSSNLPESASELFELLARIGESRNEFALLLTRKGLQGRSTVNVRNYVTPGPVYEFFVEWVTPSGASLCWAFEFSRPAGEWLLEVALLDDTESVQVARERVEVRGSLTEIAAVLDRLTQASAAWADQR